MPNTVALQRLYRLPQREAAWRAVYRNLRKAVLQGDLSPGVRFREQDLATSIGVSRTPLREALARLQADGLMEAKGRGGYIVIDPKAGLHDAYHLRSAIEGYAVRLAAERASDFEIARLRDNVEASRETDFSDTVKRAKLNIEFHLMISTASRSARLLHAFNNHREIVMTDEEMTLHTEDSSRQFLREHDLIVSAVEMRDGDTADRIMRAHLRHAATLLRQGPDAHAAELAREESE